MSLADELLADLEENDDADTFMEEPEPNFIPASVSKVLEEGYSLYMLAIIFLFNLLHFTILC